MVASEGHVQTYPAVAGSVRAARDALVSCARSTGASEDQLESIKLAASEALTNVVRHAYDGGAGKIHVTAAQAADEFWILIGDDGGGLHARDDTGGLGMGLALIACVTDYFAVVKRSSGGTEIRMCFKIPARDPEPTPGPQLRGSLISASAPA